MIKIVPIMRIIENRIVCRKLFSIIPTKRNIKENIIRTDNDIQKTTWDNFLLTGSLLIVFFITSL